jgi:hypothetical protein
MKEATITIDGREFHGVTQELSAEQDSFIIGQLRLAGALPALVAMKKNATEEQAETLLTQIMVSGRMYQILAGVLTEKDKSWSFDDATRNGARFAAVSNPVEKAAMCSAVVDFVANFFLYAVQSARTSQKSSSRSSKAAPGASGARKT